jgi:hypothetical protein
VTIASIRSDDFWLSVMVALESGEVPVDITACNIFNEGGLPFDDRSFCVLCNETPLYPPTYKQGDGDDPLLHLIADDSRGGVVRHYGVFLGKDRDFLGVVLNPHDYGDVKERIFFIDLNEQGCITGRIHKLDSAGSIVDLSKERTYAAIALDVAMNVALLNVRNTRHIEQTIPRAALRRMIKRGQCVPVDTFTYRMIQVGGDAQGNGAFRTQDENGKPIPRHLVRGHFARYSEEKPLFGKYVGTFWVTPHWRGDEEFGEVRKGYTMAAPEVSV